MWPSEKKSFQKILVIQTAFIGDVVLATAFIWNLKQAFPKASISVLVRQGNESLLENNPAIDHVFTWDKRNHKWLNLLSLIKKIRRGEFDLVITLQRFLSSGIMAVFSGAKEIWGFKKNPLARFFKKALPHDIGSRGMVGYKHEVDRNNSFLSEFLSGSAFRRRPVLYPSQLDDETVLKWKNKEYITISPSSVWFTKQWPREKWLELIHKTDNKFRIILLGGPSDKSMADWIQTNIQGNRDIINLAGELTFLQSASVMRDAARNFTNDSAPMHISSAVNSPTTALFCSTIPEFGFGPLSEQSEVWQVNKLYCKPCGLHGFQKCPEGHFRCAWEISIPEQPV